MKIFFGAPMEHLLFEHSGGYALFELKEYEDMSRSSYDEYMRLAQVLRFKSGIGFESLGVALDHQQHLSRGEVHEDLRSFLEFNGVSVLHCDASLRKGLEEVGIKQKTSENIMRGVRKEARRLVKVGEYGNMQMTLGLAYAYSREKVEYNVKREDGIAIHTVLLLEQMDKDINSYSMRIREIYGWSFPELSCMLRDNGEYIEAVRYLISQEYSQEESVDLTGAYSMCREKLLEIEERKKKSMGVGLSEMDAGNLVRLIEIVDEKMCVRRKLVEYLREKMKNIAPNLAAILGDVLAAKLISQAGGLTNLGKAPASTLQLLGAEKSLFRCLKTRGNTPKYGLLYGASFLSRVRERDKGRMSRYIASKCTIACRMDCFSEERTGEYGAELRELIERKIESLHTESDVERTGTVMQRVFEKIQKSMGDGWKEESPSLQTEVVDKENVGDKRESDRGSGRRGKRKRSLHVEESFRFEERTKKVRGRGDRIDSVGSSKRVSFDLTRNDIKETEKVPKRFKKNGKKF